jgi:hypothetical protein
MRNQGGTMKGILLLVILALAPAVFGQPRPRGTLEQQRVCAVQAAKEVRAVPATELVQYNSHYDPAVNICYVRVVHFRSAGTFNSTSTEVYDAFEGRVYGWIESASYGPNKGGYFSCSVGKVTCRSGEEFLALVEAKFGL